MTIVFSPFGGKTYYLGSSIGSTDTSILLSSFTEPVTGIPYTMTLINSTIVFATIAPKTAQSEFISFTGITQNANGTALLTGVTRGLAKKYPFTSSSSYQVAHAGQSIFIISDAPQLFNEYATLGNDETFTGQITFSLPPIGINPGGTANASTTVSGIVQEATVAQVNSGTGTGGTGAILFASPADLASSIYGLQLPTSAQKSALAGTGTPSGSNKFVTADTNALNQLLSNLSTDGTFASNSDSLYPSQKAAKTYVGSYVGSFVGVPTTFSGTTTVNNDTTFTCNFTAKNITIYYRIRGSVSGTSTYSYGIASWNGTSIVSNYIMKNNVATDNFTGAVPSVTSGLPFAGVNSGSDASMTLSVTTVTSSTFIVRAAAVENGGGSSNWEATYYVLATQ